MSFLTERFSRRQVLAATPRVALGSALLVAGVGAAACDPEYERSFNATATAKAEKKIAQKSAVAEKTAEAEARYNGWPEELRQYYTDFLRKFLGPTFRDSQFEILDSEAGSNQAILKQAHYKPVFSEMVFGDQSLKIAAATVYDQDGDVGRTNIQVSLFGDFTLGLGKDNPPFKKHPELLPLVTFGEKYKDPYIKIEALEQAARTIFNLPDDVKFQEFSLPDYFNEATQQERGIKGNAERRTFYVPYQPGLGEHVIGLYGKEFSRVSQDIPFRTIMGQGKTDDGRNFTVFVDTAGTLSLFVEYEGFMDKQAADKFSRTYSNYSLYKDGVVRAWAENGCGVGGNGQCKGVHFEGPESLRRAYDNNGFLTHRFKPSIIPTTFIQG